MTSATDIISYARNLLRTGSDSDVPVIGDEFMLKALSDANMEWTRAFRRGGGTEPIVFQRESGIDLVADTTLSADLSTSDTSASLTSIATNAPATSYVIVWDDEMPDIIGYPSFTSNTLNGITAPTFAHESGDAVQFLYPLSSTFSSFKGTSLYGDGVRLNGVALRYMEGFPDPGYFSLFDDGTGISPDKFLILPRNSTGSASILYHKASATIDSMDDTVDVPPEFDFFLIWRLVQFGHAGKGDDDAKYLRAKSEANRILQEALTDRNVGKFVRARPIRSHNPRYYDPSFYRQDA
jgi:hypothetical protein